MRRKIIRIISLLSITLSLIVTPVLAEYERSEWRHWIDADKDCQNTRQEILIRDSLYPITLREDGWAVTSGVWKGQFTGKVFTDPLKLDIDHIVPLEWAHLHGGKKWSKAMKKAFANDPENLLAVYLSANRSKGSKGPDEWMPPLSQWRSIVNRYGLNLSDWPECR